MNIGFGISLPGMLRSAAGPTEAQKQTQIAQGGGSENARDRVVTDKRRERAMQSVSARLTSLKLPQKAAQVGKKKGA